MKKLICSTGTTNINKKQAIAVILDTLDLAPSRLRSDNDLREYVASEGADISEVQKELVSIKRSVETFLLDMKQQL